MSQSKEKKSRRKFLSLSLLTGAALVAGKTEAKKPEGEKVQMLTPDGQLVEVDKSVLSNSANRQKAGNKEILNWSKSVK